MADPSKYTPTYSFTGFQAQYPTSPMPAPRLDEQFDNISQSLNQGVDALRDIRRSDGKLKNQIVTPETLSPGLNIGFTMAGQWELGRSYVSGDGVVHDQKFYVALAENTASAANEPGLDASTWGYLFAVDDLVVAGALSIPVVQGIGDGTTKTFDLPVAPASVNNVFAKVGVNVQSINQYTVSGATLTFGTAPSIGVAYEIRILSTVAVSELEAEVYAARDLAVLKAGEAAASQAAAATSETNAAASASAANSSKNAAATSETNAAVSASSASSDKEAAEVAADRAEAAASAVEFPVSYAPQTLTEEQQHQARENINAVNVDGDTFTGNIEIRKNLPALTLSSPNEEKAYRLFANVSDTVDGGVLLRRVAGDVPVADFGVGGFALDGYGNIRARVGSVVYSGAAYLANDGNLIGSIWEPWGSELAFQAISARIEARAQAWAVQEGYNQTLTYLMGTTYPIGTYLFGIKSTAGSVGTYSTVAGTDVDFSNAASVKAGGIGVGTWMVVGAAMSGTVASLLKRVG